MKKVSRSIIALSLAVASCLPAVAARSVWESAGSLTTRELERIDDSGVELTADAEGSVTLILARPMQVKVLTILGQTIGQQTLPAGVHRLKLATRGIYIVKVGQLTRRITI